MDIRNYMYLYVGCDVLLGFAHACKVDTENTYKWTNGGIYIDLATQAPLNEPITTMQVNLW